MKNILNTKENEMSNKKLILVISGLLLVIIIVAVFSFNAKKEVAIGAADAGKNISLKQGDTLVVTLDGNVTTGYTWETTQEIPVLKQVGTAEQTPSNSNLGAPGQIVLKFQAVQAGQGKLTLVYHRPFEKDVPPLKTYSVDVTVQ